MYLLPIIAQTINRRPVCPTLIHDPTTRLIVTSVLLLISIGILYRVWGYFNEI
jgi:hypothetical protein